MNEDNTFDRLRRPPFEEMWEIYKNHPEMSFKNERVSLFVIRAFLKQYGWSEREFTKLVNERYGEDV
jgi:hypothetical protein